MSRVLVSNQRSRPRLSVTEATIATTIAGTAAINENSATMRTCSREAAFPDLRAETMRKISRQISRIKKTINATLTITNAIVTLRSGVIGVMPIRMAKEIDAVISAETTVIIPGNARSLRPSPARDDRSSPSISVVRFAVFMLTMLPNSVASMQRIVAKMQRLFTAKIRVSKG